MNKNYKLIKLSSVILYIFLVVFLIGNKIFAETMKWDISDHPENQLTVDWNDYANWIVENKISIIRISHSNSNELYPFEEFQDGSTIAKSRRWYITINNLPDSAKWPERNVSATFFATDPAPSSVVDGSTFGDISIWEVTPSDFNELIMVVDFTKYRSQDHEFGIQIQINHLSPTSGNSSYLIDKKKIGLKDAIIALQISAGQILKDTNACDESTPYKCKNGNCVSSPLECFEDDCPENIPYKCTSGKCVSDPSECISSASIYWSGPGGDMWNTNSSPFNVDPNEPFNILWASKSLSGEDGSYFRPSGLVLADIGISKTRYIFGNAGWSQNRIYRKNREDGSSSNWISQNTKNDSGTGFRIAISPDGEQIYHIDVGHTIRAFNSIENPNGQPLWSKNYSSNSKGIKFMIKVGPDSRIYGHFNGTVALNPQNGEICWETKEDLEKAIFPGAFFKTNQRVLYLVSGISKIISAYDIQSESGSDPIWFFTDTEIGRPSPTIDPKTGDIYIFRQTRVIKLNIFGELIWESTKIDSDNYWGRIHGALSQDASTYYYQTGGADSSGKLYAFNTSDGSLKWKLKTNARENDLFGGPVVSNNSLIFIGNGAYKLDGNNQVFCIEDAGQNNPVVIDILDLHDESGAPHISIGPKGVIYFDGCIEKDNPTSSNSYLFAFKSNVDSSYQNTDPQGTSGGE